MSTWPTWGPAPDHTPPRSPERNAAELGLHVRNALISLERLEGQLRADVSLKDTMVPLGAHLDRAARLSERLAGELP